MRVAIRDDYFDTLRTLPYFARLAGLRAPVHDGRDSGILSLKLFCVDDEPDVRGHFFI